MDLRKTLCTLFAALPLLGGPVAAADLALPDEQANQQQIYSSRGEKQPSGYITGRSLFAYSAALPAAFPQALASLSSQDRWLDIGCGEGRAILDYAVSKYDAMFASANPQPHLNLVKAHAVGVSIEDRRGPEWHQIKETAGDRIRYLSGKSFREYTPEELGGRFQLITDVFGGFSYARDLTVFMEKSLGILDVGGSLFTLLQDVRFEGRQNEPYYKDSAFLTEIRDGAGKEVRISEWLKSISCVEVTAEMKDAQPPVEMYHIKKTCENVNVPKLVPTHFQAGTPPERAFQLLARGR